jgi:hypothetical protein
VQRHTRGLAGLLIDTVMSVRRKSTALASLKIHDVLANLAAAKFRSSLVRLVEESKVNAEGGVGELGAGDGLEDKIYGSTLFERGELSCDMGKNTTLCWDGVQLTN